MPPAQPGAYFCIPKTRALAPVLKFFPAFSFVLRRAEEAAQKWFDTSLRGRNAAPLRKRPHSGSQGRTCGLCALYRQLLLHSLTLQFGHLPLVTLLQDLVHGNDGAAQVSVFPNTVFHLYLRPFRDDEPVFLQQAHMLGDGIAGEMQDFRRVEHIISASKVPFGWSALVSCRDLKSLTVPKRCRRMSLAAVRRSPSCFGNSHMRK